MNKTSEKNLKDIDAQELIAKAEEIAKNLKNVKTSQIRKFLGEVISIESSIREDKFKTDDVVYLKVYLAYAAGRNKKLGMFKEALEILIDKIEDGEDFKVFCKFIRAIVAYHRFHGGSL